jgi:hypothetical protein
LEEKPLSVMSSADDRLWTVEDLSAYLGIPVTTLYRWLPVPLRTALPSRRPTPAIPTGRSRRLIEEATMSIAPAR